MLGAGGKETNKQWCCPAGLQSLVEKIDVNTQLSWRLTDAVIEMGKAQGGDAVPSTSTGSTLFAFRSSK